MERLITAHETSWRTPVEKVRPERAAAFHVAGRRLAELAQHDRLTRDLHDVLADHVLAAWARGGIAKHHQAFYAALAADIVLGRIAGQTLRNGAEQIESGRR
ncbi:hypothetical protein [Nonomuraea jabiensis]|uniref:hypothetical protein n=1 Tax=Nonomuraea jabiensis TaxID=882448 RepID=UPI003D751798